jgi:hypothetical protein
MKKILFALFIALALVACKMSTDEPTVETPAADPPAVASPNVYVYNSAWQIVKQETLTANRVGANISKDISSADALEAEVAAYNAANTDDQWQIVEGEEVPIEQSPDATVYIVNAATLAIYYEGVVARTDLVERREAWRISVEAFDDPLTHKNAKCTLYIDNIPPEPPVVVEPEPKLWTALLDLTARKVYWSEHHDTEVEAIQRYQMGMCAQADLYNLGDQDDEIDVPGHVYQAYIGEIEYTFSVQE